MLKTRSGTSPTPQHSDIFVRKVRGMGRGVFASRAFRKAELIEVCPVILLPGITDEEQLGGMRKYVFQWHVTGDVLAIALGYGSLYNHDPNPNAEFTLRHARNEIVFRAVRKIEPGEQILIDYRWDETDYAAFRKKV
jgi:SET domain-containing protein